jgi:hypothetical protein
MWEVVIKALFSYEEDDNKKVIMRLWVGALEPHLNER